jgi:DNA gyrase/topoisomerase IV subunit A
LRLAAARLVVLDAVVKALDRRAGVVEVASTSENADAARRELSRLLDVPEVGANAVLELHVRRYTMQEARRVRAERDEVLAVLQSR